MQRLGHFIEIDADMAKIRTGYKIYTWYAEKYRYNVKKKYEKKKQQQKNKKITLETYLCCKDMHLIRWLL